MKNNKTIENLEKVLATSYLLMLKTHNYHWNIVGSNFKPLHELFQLQYEELFTAIDELAERIRALGSKVNGTIENFSEKSLVKKIDNSLNDKAMVADLIVDNEVLIKILKEGIKIAQSAEDEVTAGMLTNRVQIHEKTAWMLQSSI
jgi:starvation-inducible DNA-binding protein